MFELLSKQNLSLAEMGELRQAQFQLLKVPQLLLVIEEVVQGVSKSSALFKLCVLQQRALAVLQEGDYKSSEHLGCNLSVSTLSLTFPG